VLYRLPDWRGVPFAIRLDNGLELFATEFVTYCERRGIELRHIQPGKPDQYAFIEYFNCRYRAEVLNAHLFADLEKVR
jgi:putative transposase